MISKAHLICLFGSAIGETDKIWWMEIGEQLKRGVRIIIFSIGEEVNQRTSYKISRIGRAVKQRFLNKTNLSESEKEEFAANIYIGVYTDLFSIM